jgi:hypothetical protein
MFKVISQLGINADMASNGMMPPRQQTNCIKDSV